MCSHHVKCSHYLLVLYQFLYCHFSHYVQELLFGNLCVMNLLIWAFSASSISSPLLLFLLSFFSYATGSISSTRLLMAWSFISCRGWTWASITIINSLLCCVMILSRQGIVEILCDCVCFCSLVLRCATRNRFVKICTAFGGDIENVREVDTPKPQVDT